MNKKYIKLGKHYRLNVATFTNNIIWPILIGAELIGAYCVVLWMGGFWR